MEEWIARRPPGSAASSAKELNAVTNGQKEKDGCNAAVPTQLTTGGTGTGGLIGTPLAAAGCSSPHMPLT